MPTYNELLNTARWRARSRSIKERDNYVCQDCESRDRQFLEVHHLKYTTAMPWDEPGANLITLCDRCHFARHRENLNQAPTHQVRDMVAGLIKTL